MCLGLISHNLDEEAEKIRREKGDAAAAAYRTEYAIGMTKLLLGTAVGGLTGGPIGAATSFIRALKG